MQHYQSELHNNSVMNLNRNILPFILGSFLLLSSCNRDNTEMITFTTDFPEPIALETNELSGFVLNQADQAIKDVTVELIRQGIVLDQVVTDENGRYIFTSFPEIDGQVTVVFKKDNFFPNINVLDKLEEDFVLSPKMVNANEYPNQKDFESIENEELILVSGQVFGNSSSSIVFALNEEENWVNYTFIEDGKYKILIPKNSAFNFFSYNECGINTADSNEYGPFEMEQQLTVFWQSSEYNQKRLFGEITCQGEKINDAIIEVRYIEEFTDWGIPSKSRINVLDGSFDIPLYDCFSNGIIVISVFDNETGITTNPIFINYAEFEDKGIDLDLCKEDDWYFNLNVDGMTLDLGQHIFKQINDDLILVSPNNIFGISFGIKEYVLGENEIEWINILMNSNVAYLGWETDMIFNITEINEMDESFIEGKIEGSFFDFYKQKEILVEGECRLKLE